MKLIGHEGELYILGKSAGRIDKERGIRRKRMQRLVKRLHELHEQKLTRDELLLKLGAAKKDAGQVYAVVNIDLPPKDQARQAHSFKFSSEPREASSAAPA